jgi:hypothetical protein
MTGQRFRIFNQLRFGLLVAIRCFLMDTFNAEQFLAKLNRGDFDGHLHDVLRKLSREQLEQVAALLIAKRARGLSLTGSLGGQSDT